MSKKNDTHVDDLDDPKYDGPPDVAVQDELIAATASPGDADYDWSPHYDGAELYHHTFPNGVVVAIKTFNAIYTKTWLYSIRNLQTNVDFEFAAIDRAACETAQEVLSSLADEDGDPVEELFKAWTSSGTSHGAGDEGLDQGK